MDIEGWLRRLGLERYYRFTTTMSMARYYRSSPLRI